MAGTGREQLQDVLGHKSQSPRRLERALTHSSCPSEKSAISTEEIPGKTASPSVGETEKKLARGIESRTENSEEKTSSDDNEKLEFLGDAVLTMIVSEALLHGFPDWREGQLSKARASLVNAGALAEAARRIDLGA